jgi:hypothetical protein
MILLAPSDSIAIDAAYTAREFFHLRYMSGLMSEMMNHKFALTETCKRYAAARRAAFSCSSRLASLIHEE